MKFIPLRRQWAIRDEIVKVGHWGVKETERIHYGQIRPIPVHLPPFHLPLTTDCSGWIDLCFMWGGARDPLGMDYSGFGSTYNLIKHGWHVELDAALPGDVIVYGPTPGHHAVLVIEKGVDPTVISHGQEKGPIVLKHSVEQKYQPKPARAFRYRLR